MDGFGKNIDLFGTPYAGFPLKETLKTLRLINRRWSRIEIWWSKSRVCAAAYERICARSIQKIGDFRPQITPSGMWHRSKAFN
eukprot:1160032-Pelagomonas_calceolata.AAC.10